MKKKEITPITASGWLITGVILLIISVMNLNQNPISAILVVMIAVAMIMHFAEVQTIIKREEEDTWDYDELGDDIY